MVRPKEFESLTAGTANRCSIQLSYGRILLETEIIADKPYDYLSWWIFRTNSTSAFDNRNSRAIASTSTPSL